MPSIRTRRTGRRCSSGNTIKAGDFFIDVGANIGIYTIFALDLGAEVIAIESTRNAERVREHLQLNGYEAEVLQKALADRPGTVRITKGLDSLNHLVWEPGQGVEVEATTLDAVLGDRVAAGVKIDVEGAERLVLQGAERALCEHRIELLQIEWAPEHSAATLGEDWSPVADLLRNHGYVLHWPDRSGQLHRLTEGETPTVNLFALPKERSLPLQQRSGDLGMTSLDCAAGRLAGLLLAGHVRYRPGRSAGRPHRR